MSFYGNIANGSKTNLTFDKVYPNRSQMDSAVESDGVFIGRFVLVEYDDNSYSYRRGYLGTEGVPTDTEAQYRIFADTTLKAPYVLTESDPESGYGLLPGDIVSVTFSDKKKNQNEICYFKAENLSFIDGDGNPIGVVFTLIDIENRLIPASDYTLNYNIDKKAYKNNFVDGWDSTIWQKVVENGEYKYIMVGELNSKPPRFDIRSEAPTAEPIAPHFDDNSTNMDYTLHVQPTWGFRVKKADSPELSSIPQIDSDYIDYNKDADTIIVEKGYYGDIYFNHEGFNKELRHPVEIGEEFSDKITVTPTGFSGTKYYTHNPRKQYAAAEDIQELSINLPSIGNAVSELWDLMYADYAEDENGVWAPLEQRNDDIEWNSLNGARLVSESQGGFTYDPKRIETVAGAINSIHDLMGMIVVEGDDVALSEASTEKIYYGVKSASGRPGYFIKTPKTTYTPLKQSDLKNYVENRKYFSLTQYKAEEYHTKVGQDFYYETSEKPTPNTSYYKLNPTKINLLPWEHDGPEEEGLKHYYLDENFDYIKDTNETPDENKEYFTLALHQVTYLETNEEDGAIRTEFFNPKAPIEYVIDEEGNIIDIPKNEEEKPGEEIVPPEGNEGEIPDEEIVNSEGNEENIELLDEEVEDEEEVENEEVIINGTRYFRGYIALEVSEVDEEGNPTKYILNELDENDVYKDNALYFYVPKYLKTEAYPEGSDPIITLKWEDGTSMTPESLKNSPYEMIFISPFEDNKYYSANWDYSVLTCLHDEKEADNTVIYFTVKAIPETGDLSEKEEGEEGEGEGEVEEETLLTYYYKPGIYYYKINANDYILGLEEEMLTEFENKPVEYFILDGHTEAQDILFYEPGKYYYYNATTKSDTLDNSETMKTYELDEEGNPILDGTDLSADWLGENGEIYYIKQEAYIVNDPSGILSAGSIWNSGANFPTTLEFGKLYQGEAVVEEYQKDEHGQYVLDENNQKVTIEVELNTEERAERMYQWKELKGFARTLNTIHGLILKVNQFFKFDDTLTRDRTTIQGCLNCINDIINDFATLVPGEIAVIDEYGRIKSAKLFTTATDESNDEGWISVLVDPNATTTKITIRHNDAKAVPDENLLGQLKDDAPGFGGTFNTVGFGIDEKGHVDPNQFKEYQITLPSLDINDNDEGQILVDLEFVHEDSDNGEVIKISRENVGNFTLIGYECPETADDVADTDTVNTAFGKLQRLLNNEVENRSNADTALQNNLDAETKSRTDEDKKLQDNLDAEAETRAEEDKKLQNALNTEQENRIKADEDLQSQIDAEIKNREKEDKKLQDQLDILNADDAQEGSVAYKIAQIVLADNNGKIDKLNEIATWIVSDETGAAKMSTDIATNAKNISTNSDNIQINADAIADLEELVGSTAVATQIATKINEALLIDGVDKYALAKDLSDLAEDLKDLTERVTDIEEILTVEKLNQWNNAEANVQSDWNETDSSKDSFILNKPSFENYVQNTTLFPYGESNMTLNQLFDYIFALETRIYNLEHPTSDEGNTESN